MTETHPLASSAASPAATVAVLRDGDGGLEVLLVRRNPKGSFAGMWVFPGGRVDVEDLRAAVGGVMDAGTGIEGADGEVAAARHAAGREAEEEAGLRLDRGRMEVLSWWLPPAEAARRFATWFFVAAVAPGHAVVIDQTEVHDHVWVEPAEALARRDRDELSLAPPTWMTLHWLAQHRDAASVLAAAASRPPERFVTHAVFSRPGTLAAVVWEGDEGYEDGDLERPGPRRRLVTGERSWHFESSPGRQELPGRCPQAPPSPP
ncbi:MAG: NUDIX domain-containing protein [Actinomycetota bacterium]|nr:NUDIX domain-containing protein [Actinomycetota bacterium]